MPRRCWQPLNESVEVLESMVKARTDRQVFLQSSDSPQSTFYIHELALELEVGTAAIMYEQVKRLAFMCDWNRMSLRLIPSSVHGPALPGLPVALLTFAKGVSSLAYADVDVSMIFTERPQEIEYYRRKFAMLDVIALDENQTREIFEERANVWECASD